MIPELGQLALILVLCLGLIQATVPLVGAARGRADWMALARPTAAGQFVFAALAFGVLAHAFLTDDFSVEYVALHSNSNLPTFYKFAAVWGGHEGSLLFWIAVLAIWTLAVAWSARGYPQEFTSRVLAVLGIVSVGVTSFTLLTSNPFLRLTPPAFDGNDLNPLLQDPAMVLHPPMLYVGYVGTSVPFAFAVAALLTGRLDKNWARWARPWTVVAWIFLTCGIALGSWWAYYELGWGGWWFWDPVENASFMPWLIGTALIHSLAVTERRGIFKSWSVLLAIAAFSLSLLGTFLVRSGVLVSVHAFASDPARGLYILMLLALMSGGSLLLYAIRAQHLEAEGGFRPASREAFLLANNVLLVVATGGVLFGTLYPMFHDALGLGKISVGPPYFTPMFVLPMLPLVLLLGVGMHAVWKSMSLSALAARLKWPAAIALVLGIALPLALYGAASVMTIVGVIAGVWVCSASLLDPVRRLTVARHLPPLTRSQWGMCLAHLGVGIFVIGATVTTAYNIERDFAARPGDRLEAGGYEFVFTGLEEVTGVNYDAIEAEFEVWRDGELVSIMRPQQRTYRVQRNVLPEAAIDFAPTRDVLVTLGQPLGNDAWSVRLQVKPLIRFIWLGALVMAFGGLLAATDRRYRQPVREAAHAPQPAAKAVEQGG